MGESEQAIPVLSGDLCFLLMCTNCALVLGWGFVNCKSLLLPQLKQPAIKG